MTSSPAHTPASSPWPPIAPATEGAAYWKLAEAISPRRGLRTDAWDETTSTWRHQYDHQPWPDAPPQGPYALYLTDNAERFRLLCFDLDVTRGDVDTDLARLRDLLDTVGAHYIVAASGAGGGRHVWLSPGPDGAAPLAVRRLAKLLARALPTLDHGMLCNPSTGAARPPGAPHRAGGHSVLLHPATPLAATAMLESNVPALVERLTEALIATVSTPDERATTSPTAREIVQRGGGPALAGLRREPSPGTRVALDTTPRTGEASGHLATVLIGLALARWSWREVHALLDYAPGLEHARTRSNPRAGATRIPRGLGEASAVLRRQWRRCVEYSSRLPPSAVRDDVNRSEETAHYVAALQDALDKDPARWARQSGPADRGVLDAACLVALEACSIEIDLDVRRAAAMAGISKSAAARAFNRLSLDGYLQRTAEAEGPRAATWKLLAPATSSTQLQGGTQGPRPPHTLREDLHAHLRESLRVRSADAFAPRKVGGLGRHCARIAAACLNPVTAAKLSRICGYTVRTCERHLATMRSVALIRRTRSGSANLKPSMLIRAARHLGTHGYRAERARWTLVDREVYAWWREEEHWMRAPKRPRRPRDGERHLQLWGVSRREPFPRTGKRADFAKARFQVAIKYGLLPGSIPAL